MEDRVRIWFSLINLRSEFEQSSGFVSIPFTPGMYSISPCSTLERKQNSSIAHFDKGCQMRSKLFNFITLSQCYLSGTKEKTVVVCKAAKCVFWTISTITCWLLLYNNFVFINHSIFSFRFISYWFNIFQHNIKDFRIS